jgi:hypothetical protein
MRRGRPAALAAAARTVLPALFLAAALAGAARAETYKSPEAFVREAAARASPGAPVEPGALFLTRALQGEVAEVLGHPYKSLRVRYWRVADETIWVLDEIGKEEDITIGFAVRDAEIRRTEVLEFRESRGWEIRFPSFTRQFLGAGHDPGGDLDRPVDGITGATLSVGAYHRLARLALLLHAKVLAGGR